MRIISGSYRSRRLLPFEDSTIRPVRDRVREAAFNMLSSLLQWEWDGLQVIDLFAGTGILGFEALSRGASHVTFVEKSRPSLKRIEQNVHHLGIPPGRVTLLCTDALTFTPPPEHLTFLDPPYGQGIFPSMAIPGLYVAFTEPEACLSAHLTVVKDRTIGKTRIRCVRVSQ